MKLSAPFGIRLTVKTLKWVDALAEKQVRDRAEVVRLIVEYAFQKGFLPPHLKQ